MKNQTLIAAILGIFLITLSLLISCSGSDDDSGVSHPDDDTTDDDTKSDDSIDDDSVADDAGQNDDTILDDDTIFIFPKNIDLYGAISWVVVVDPHLPDLYFGGINQYSQQNFGEIAQWPECQLNDIWGSSPTDIYAIGIGENLSTYNGFLAHYNGVRWTVTRYTEHGLSLDGIYGSSSIDVYIVGHKFDSPYEIYHYDGSTMVIEKTGWLGSHLNAVWASPTGFVIAVGYNNLGYLFVTKENGVWRENTIFANIGGFSAVWGTLDDVVFAAGGELNPSSNSFKYYVFRYLGGNWEKMNAPEVESVNLYKIAGISSTDVYAIGFLTDENYSKGLLHYDGTSWTRTTIPAGEQDDNAYPGALWVAAHDSVFVSIHIGLPYIYSKMLYFDGNFWYSLSQDKVINALWGFVNP